MVAMKQGLYAQVVMIRQKYLDKKSKEKTKKYNFRGESARSKHWFEIDHGLLEEKLVDINQISIKKLSNYH